MRITKKIIALSLAVFMLASTFVTASALTFTDVTDNTKYSEAISTMVALELLKGYPDGTFLPQNTITRAEFSAVMTRAIGMEGVIGSSSSRDIFTDMTVNGADHWATGYVKIAYDRGIVLGMGDGTFAPDSPVTYEQAVKMIVCALGRESAAIAEGGWPGGYLSVANSIGLTDGATYSPTNGPASRGIVAQLVFNALDIKLMEPVIGYGISLTDKTLLKDMLKVTKFKNMLVTEVDGTLSINAGANKAKTREMVIESGLDVLVCKYENALTSNEAKELLGHYVNGYYKVNTITDEKTLIMVKTSSEKTQEITIASKNIDSFSNLKLNYWENEYTDSRTQQVKIASTAKLIYNGVAYNYLSSNVPSERNLTYWLSPSSPGFINGEVRMLDSGADGEYDSLFIDNYETYVVKSSVKTNDSVYTNNYIIYDYYTNGKSIQIDPYDRNNTVAIYNAKTGATMSIESLKSMDILSVAASADLKYFKCYVSTDRFSGEIESMSGTNPPKYYINNKAYEITPEFATVIANGKVSMDIGSSGTFYLDKDGKIAAASITATQTGNYAYITAVGKYDIFGEDAAIELLPLTGSQSTPKKYKAAKSLRINNQTYTNQLAIENALKASALLLDSNTSATNATYSQLVKVGINSDDEVTSIITPSVKQDGTLDVGANTNSGVFRIGQKNKEYTYSTGSQFESQVFMDSSTLVLIAPTNRREGDKYKRYTGANAPFNSGSKYTIEAYDMNASAIAKVIVVFGSTANAEVESTAPASIVKNCTQILNSITGRYAYSVEVYEDGVIRTYETEDDSNKFALGIGDIVRLGFNSDGQISKVVSQVDASNLVAEKKHKPGDEMEGGDYKFKAILGTVCSLTPERIIIAPAFVDNTGATPTLFQDDKEGYLVNPGVKVYRVNQLSSTVDANLDINNIVEFGDTSVNSNASKVYAYSISGELKMIVIYQ